MAESERRVHAAAAWFGQWLPSKGGVPGAVSGCARFKLHFATSACFATLAAHAAHLRQPRPRTPARAYSPSKVIHRWRGGSFISPPQPAVNNFGGGAKMSGAKLSLLLNPWVEHAGAGRRIPRSNAPTFPRRLSLRHPAPGRQGTLRTFRLQVQTGQRRTSISDSIRPGPRARQN